MSNVATIRINVGAHAHVETLANGKPLERPIRLRTFESYLSVETAEAIGLELLAAARKARQLAGTEKKL